MKLIHQLDVRIKEQEAEAGAHAMDDQEQVLENQIRAAGAGCLGRAVGETGSAVWLVTQACRLQPGSAGSVLVHDCSRHSALHGHSTRHGHIDTQCQRHSQSLSRSRSHAP